VVPSHASFDLNRPVTKFLDVGGLGNLIRSVLLSFALWREPRCVAASGPARMELRRSFALLPPCFRVFVASAATRRDTTGGVDGWTPLGYDDAVGAVLRAVAHDVEDIRTLVLRAWYSRRTHPRCEAKRGEPLPSPSPDRRRAACQYGVVLRVPTRAVPPCKSSLLHRSRSTSLRTTDPVVAILEKGGSSGPLRGAAARTLEQTIYRQIQPHPRSS
jgi:hypothetical protein